jgi:hypothetical protein
MCGDLNELVWCVCLCHGWYYSGDGRNGNGIFEVCCIKNTVDKCVDKLWISLSDLNN